MFKYVFVWSIIWLLTPGVKSLEEGALVLVFLLIESRKSIAAINGTSGDGRDRVEDVPRPDIAVLNVVEALIPVASEHVDRGAVAHFAIGSPVIGQVQLRSLWISIPSVAGIVNNEWHVSAPLPEKSERLEVSLGERS